jgi:cell filamentation protein
MYRSEPDPYCYPGTTVLINRLDIRDQPTLDAFEAEMTSERASEPLPTGPLTSDCYLAIHRHLFQDVYDWAGNIRTIRISKGSSTFCYPEHIRRELDALFDRLAAGGELRHLDPRQFADEAAAFIAELNAIQPFREGNGRTQLAFLVVLSEQAGHPLDLSRLDPDAILSATIASFSADSRQLADIVYDLIKKATKSD